MRRTYPIWPCAFALMAVACDSAKSDVEQRDASVDGESLPAPEQCPSIDDPFGFGIRVEGQCASNSYSGTGVVSEVVSPVIGSTDYYVELTEHDRTGGCASVARIWIATNQLSPVLPLAVGQEVVVDFRSELDLDRRALFVFMTIEEAGSGELLFAHHDWDDRFIETGTLAIGPFALRLASPCSFDAPCYLEAIRYRLEDSRRGVDLGEFTSASVEVNGRDFGVYVTSSRYSNGRMQTNDCFAGHYEPGYRLAFDLVALSR